MDWKKLTLGIFLIVDLMLGLTCIACGLWFHASKDIYAYMTVFVRSENDRILIGAAGVLLAIGFILSFLVFVAGFGLVTGRYQFVKLFAAVVWIITIMGLIAGFMVVGFRHDIHRFVKSGMRNQLQNQYSWDSKIGKAWNRVQVKKRCCGVDGSWDYRDSAWFATQNPDPPTVNEFVPQSCCVLNFNQDQQLWKVDPQNLQPKDLLRCNQDAEGHKDGSANLHGKGCFAALFSRNKELFTKNKDIRRDQDIFTIMDVIEGLCISAGLFQVIVMGLVHVFLKSLNRTNREKNEKQLRGRY